MYPNNIHPNQYQGVVNHPPPMNQPPPLNPPPLVYHFRGLHIDESLRNNLGRRAFVMRRQPGRDMNRYHQYNQSHRRGNRNNGGRPRSNEGDHECFLCGESLQNSTEPGVHLCTGDDSQSSAVTDNRPETPSQEDKDLKYLSELLDNLRKALKNSDAIKILGSCVKNLDVHTKAIDKELEKLQEDYGKQSNLSSRKIHRCVVIVRQNMAAWRVLVQKAAEETQRRETQTNTREQSLADREKEIAEEKLESECEIKRQMQELADEKQRLSELHETQKGRIKLDVGGRIFTTSISTLTRDSDSMLAAMFSGRHELIKEKDGCVFIDRDGTNFRFILNYLRDGCQSLTALPKSRQSLRELRNEAIYYQLFGLVQKVEKLI